MGCPVAGFFLFLRHGGGYPHPAKFVKTPRIEKICNIGVFPVCP